MNKKLHMAGLVLALGVLVSAPAEAAFVTWNLENVSFVDGASASGSFRYDAGTNTYANWNISVTGGVLSAYTYQPGVDFGGVGIHTNSDVDFVAFPPGSRGRYIHLNFDGILTDLGGTVNLLSGVGQWTTTSFECGNCSPLRFLASGFVTTNAVPEPAALALAGLGLAGLGFTRRRKAAKAS